MTRISGSRIILAPCCGKILTTPSYSSVNLTANEHWTDGKVVGGLFNNGGGLRLCECGEVFLLSDAKQVGTIPKEKPPAPADWNENQVHGGTGYGAFRHERISSKTMTHAPWRRLKLLNRTNHQQQNTFVTSSSNRYSQRNTSQQSSYACAVCTGDT